MITYNGHLYPHPNHILYYNDNYHLKLDSSIQSEVTEADFDTTKTTLLHSRTFNVDDKMIVDFTPDVFHRIMDSLFTHSEKYDIQQNHNGEEIESVYNGIAESLQQMIDQMLKVFPNVKIWDYVINVINLDQSVNNS